MIDFAEVFKYNPNHDSEGKFAKASGGKSLSITEDSARKFTMAFEVGGTKFVFGGNAIREQNEKTLELEPTGEWSVNFGKDFGKGNISSTLSNDMGVGAIRVFSEVAKGIAALIESKNPEAISFTASLGEPTKVEFYKKGLIRLAKKFGYIAHEPKNTWNFKEFKMTRKEEIKPFLVLVKSPAKKAEFATVFKSNP